MGDLGQAEGLHQRRHVDAEPAAKAFLEPVPATHGIFWSTQA